MNDDERDLRELFERKASSADGVAPRLPETVRRRSRRRQLGTALVSGLTALAVLAGTVGVLQAVDFGRDRQPTPADDPWEGYEVFERTAAVGNFTISSPSDWYLVNQWWIGASTITSFGGSTQSCEIGPDGEEENCHTVESSPTSVGVPKGLPVFQLSNTDHGLGMPRCGESLGEDEAVLYVAIDSDSLESGVRPPAWPTQMHDRPSGPCGAGMYASFSAGSTSYLAWIGLGGSVDEADRAELLAAFEGLQVSDETLQPPHGRGPTYVVAGGENAAGPWSLELRPSDAGPSANVQLSLTTPEGDGVRLKDVVVPDERAIEQAGADPVFGAVTREASGVELRLEEGTSPIPATIVPLPPSMPFNFDLFFAAYDGDVPALARPLGLEPTERSDTIESPSGSSEAPIVADVVTVHGNDPDLGVHWTLRLSGSVEDGDACIDLDTRIDFDPWCPFSLSSLEPAMSLWADQGRFLMVGSVPPGFDGVSFVGESWRSEGECVDGPSGWGGLRGCVLPLLGLEDGSIAFSGAGRSLTRTLDREARLVPENTVPDARAATGEFLGFPWRVETGLFEDGIDVDVDGAARSIERPALDDPVVLPFPRSEFQALLLILTDTSVDQVDVASEGRWYGRWMHSATRDGAEARLWIVELPGAGSGSLSYDGKNVGSVNWP